MDEALERLVWQRAQDRCEYCQLPREYSRAAFEIDHIIPRKHRGRTTASNLAGSCFYCNTFKGPNLSGIDSVTGKIVRLFHPRRHKWSAHFRWNGALLIGKTPIGRATIAVFSINDPARLAAREALIIEGVFPPPEKARQHQRRSK
jgi:5-methylcytosine-specific restriction endonuclease McrA